MTLRGNSVLNVSILFKCRSDIRAGYEPVQTNKANLSITIFNAIFFISSNVAMPVDIIMGLPVFLIYSISSILLFLADGILYAGTSNCSRKSTLGLSQAEASQVMPISLQYLSIS